ncbi:MAG: hypothetical protein IJU82_03565 [Ruminiclostridium sp.]|nr:hypothetical protein [Ruminiclostridium sp.]
MTARSIALISPMRQEFAALTKASEFAAHIIGKYSATEPFPLSGETLVYFNAMRERLEHEQKLRGDTTYILKLVMIRKLMLEGKLGDPTVTKLFLNTVSGSIERSLHYLRISDNNAYTRTTEALTYINNADVLSENILLSEVQEGTRLYRCSAVDIKSLTNRFFGGNSESYAYSGTYTYIEPQAFVYKKEAVADRSEASPATEPYSRVLSDNAVNAIIAGTTVAAGGTHYSYDNEDLTYKTDNSDGANVQTALNTAGTTVAAPAANVAENSSASTETVINAGDTHYSYENENLTYKTEAADARDDITPTLAEAIADIGSEKLRKVSELPEISLLVMNSFLSGGAEYISEVKNKYIHKHISLAATASPELGSTAARLLNSPAASFGVVSYAVSLLASEKELTPYERTVYDSAVTKVYTERHSYAGFDTKQMLAGMNTRERTKVLSLIVDKLGSGADKPVPAQSTVGKANDADIPATHTAAPSPAEHRSIRSVVKKLMESIIKPSGTQKPAAVQTPRESEETVRAVPVPTAEKYIVTETEMTLLKMLSEDKSGSIARASAAAERGGDTVSARLGVLYHGIAGGRSTEKIIAENVENAVYMPSVLNFYDMTRQTFAQKTANSYYTGNSAPDVTNSRMTRNTFTNTNDISVYRNDVRNINNIQTRFDVSQNAAKTAETFAPQNSDTVQSAYMSGTAAAVLPDRLYYGETVRKALEKIARYEHAAATENRTAANNAPDRASAEHGYPDVMQSFTFSTAVNGYSLPLTLAPDSKVSEDVRLLPVYTLDGVILPRKLPEIKTAGKKPLNRLSVPKKSTFTAGGNRITLLNDRKMLTKNRADSAAESVGLPSGTETYTVPMDRMMPDETVLSYREPIPVSAQASPAAAAPQPSMSDLVKRFGNLIEGGDAGLTPSFDVGNRGIGEAMAAIEETAEKVAANSKLIEEIREKQRTIEATTIRSSDIDELSEEMIRRLRSRMRLERSRFAGQ